MLSFSRLHSKSWYDFGAAASRGRDSRSSNSYPMANKLRNVDPALRWQTPEMRSRQFLTYSRGDVRLHPGRPCYKQHCQSSVLALPHSLTGSFGSQLGSSHLVANHLWRTRGEPLQGRHVECSSTSPDGMVDQPHEDEASTSHQTRCRVSWSKP